MHDVCFLDYEDMGDPVSNLFLTDVKKIGCGKEMEFVQRGVMEL